MLEWGKRTYVMGIINLTPDSFSGDGTLQENNPIEFALKQAKQFLHDGADILDLGAESSRPGSTPISSEEELDRLLPVISALKAEDIDGIISIDTYKPEVARQCLEKGAHWINDIWGLKKSPALASIIAEYNAQVILMHNRSKIGAIAHHTAAGDSYESADYSNFMEEVKNDLLESAAIATHAGIDRQNIILDPGIGFGKTVEQNLQLINHLEEIKSLGYPVLIGPSRKSFIGHVLDAPVDERLEGTAASLSVGIACGADIVRVHDVKMMTRIVRMTDALVRGIQK